VTGRIASMRAEVADVTTASAMAAPCRTLTATTPAPDSTGASRTPRMRNCEPGAIAPPGNCAGIRLAALITPSGRIAGGAGFWAESAAPSNTSASNPEVNSLNNVPPAYHELGTARAYDVGGCANWRGYGMGEAVGFQLSAVSFRADWTRRAARSLGPRAAAALSEPGGFRCC
jgi:hypothetical protein